MNIVFFGTPDFAVKPLQAIKNSSHEILAVVTQPDRPTDRGHKISQSAVKIAAKELGLPVLQYNKLRVDGLNDLRQLTPDLMVTCAYGQILSQEIIDIPKYGIINIHASLLPKYRGAAPIARAVIDGEEITGVTLMRTDKGIDTGDILMAEATDIGEDETTGELFDRLSEIGARLIVKGLNEIEEGKAIFTPQDNEKATHAKMIEKEEGKLDFSRPAKELKNLIRGLNPKPTAFFDLDGVMVKVYKSHVEDGEFDGNVGEVVVSDKKQGLMIKCGEGVLSIDELQYPNGKRLAIKDFLNGREIPKGKIL